MVDTAPTRKGRLAPALRASIFALSRLGDDLAVDGADILFVEGVGVVVADRAGRVEATGLSGRERRDPADVPAVEVNRGRRSLGAVEEGSHGDTVSEGLVVPVGRPDRQSDFRIAGAAAGHIDAVGTEGGNGLRAAWREFREDL